MKFTEGYWEKNEKANARYAVQAFSVERIPKGMRVVMPFHKVMDRAAALDVGTITAEFTFDRKDMISVRCWHFEGYRKREPRFDLEVDRQETEFEDSDEKAVLTSGRMRVEVLKKEFRIVFAADGEVLTEIGANNLGYMQYGRTVSTKYPEENYLHADYQPYMMTELSLAPGECVYGFGERFTAFVKNGQTVDIWNEDGGTASQIAYKNIPFYITSRHYGVFVDHTDLVSFEVASEKVENVGFSVKGEELRYHIIYGEDIKDVLTKYTAFTGRPALPPAWSFGLWLSTSFTTDYDEKTTGSFISGMRSRKLPFNVFHFDCFWMKEFHWCDFEWDERIFPEVEKMLSGYKEKGLRICVWINPYVAQGTAFFREGVEKGYFLMRADGKGIRQLDSWQPGMGIVDFTNPAAVKWYQDRLRRLLDMGVDCFKTDFGERIPADVLYYDGSDPWAMHNYYTYLYNKAVFEVLENTEGKNKAVVFARSATAGSQKFPVHWGGDSSGTYSSMAETLRGGLSFAMSGFSFWSHDIGGFEMTADPDVYKRWLQFGLLSSHSRLHGSKSYRVPWVFDEEAVEVCRKFSVLKNRLMPYLYSMSVTAHETGVPVLRPMIMEFEGDPAVKYLDMQYMLGDVLLVAPVFEKSGRVSYYLPEGMWTHLLSGEKRKGNRWYEETYDFMSLPLFVRDNTILPLGACDDTAEYNYCTDVCFEVFELAEGQTAQCRVPDAEGNIVLCVRMRREKNRIYIESEGENDRVTYLLRNTERIRSAENVSAAEATQKGILLYPAKENVTVEL